MLSGMKTLSQTQFYPVKTPTHSYFENEFTDFERNSFEKSFKRKHTSIAFVLSLHVDLKNF